MWKLSSAHCIPPNVVIGRRQQTNLVVSTGWFFLFICDRHCLYLSLRINLYFIWTPGAARTICANVKLAHLRSKVFYGSLSYIAFWLGFDYSGATLVTTNREYNASETVSRFQDGQRVDTDRRRQPRVRNTPFSMSQRATNTPPTTEDKREARLH